MTIPTWLGFFGGISILSLVSFLHFFIKDSRLRVKYNKKAMVLLVDCCLLFLALSALGAAIFLYMDWQSQLTYFMQN